MKRIRFIFSILASGCGQAVDEVTRELACTSCNTDDEDYVPFCPPGEESRTYLVWVYDGATFQHAGWRGTINNSGGGQFVDLAQLVQAVTLTTVRRARSVSGGGCRFYDALELYVASQRSSIDFIPPTRSPYYLIVEDPQTGAWYTLPFRTEYVQRSDGHVASHATTDPVADWPF